MASAAAAAAAKSPGWLTCSWLSVRVQIALGAIFVAAALSKIIDPPTFAHQLYNYRLLPGVLINPMALVLPWLELVVGLLLVLGLWRRTSALLIGLFLIVFTAAMAISVARGNAVNCGCFGELTTRQLTHTQMMTLLKWDIARDIAMLLLVLQIIHSENANKKT